MDLRHNHGSEVQVVRTNHDQATDLIALGGLHSVQVLLTLNLSRQTPTSCKVIANFHIGCTVTAIAWSSRCASPSSTDEWSIELACAGSNFGLYLLTKSHSEDEEVFPFGGGLSGHHGKVNDMAFCGGQSEDSSRYIATVSDDKMLMVWDLSPTINVHSNSVNSPESDDLSARPQPTAYVIAFPYPLSSVCAHPSTSKEFVVADARGSIFLTDWRSDPDQDSWRHQSVIELVEPRALADAVCGMPGRWSGSVAWRRDSVDIIGAAYGSRFALWDLSKLYGGKPTVTGPTFAEGGTKFRWCPTFSEYFAVTTNSPSKGGVINVYNTGYIQAQPTVFNIAPRPLYVRDFDFAAQKGIPRIAAAIGREVVIFYIGVDS